MLWVTFGRARISRMAFAVGAKIKDENCFAQPSDTLARIAPSHRVREGNCRPERVKAPGRLNLRGALALLIHSWKGGLNLDYCLVPVNVPSPNWPSETLPLIVLPSVLPEYFTARLPAWPSTLYSMVTSSSFTVPLTCASPS